MRFKLTVEYDGAKFCGWQLQPRQRSVQGELETALATHCQHPVRVYVAGRTDAGVHASAQVAMFDTESGRTAKEILGAVNTMLPKDMAVIAVDPAPNNFDARHWSWGKTYRYRYLSRAARSPMREGRVWHIKRELHLAAMQEAVLHWQGEHDFTSFRAARCMAAQPVRIVQTIGVQAVGDEVHLLVHGQGFLRHMVRIMAGTLRDVGIGKHQPIHAANCLAQRDRRAAGKTAPPGGLELIAIRYEDGPPPWRRRDSAK